jgi:hypothetical protein
MDTPTPAVTSCLRTCAVVLPLLAGAALADPVTETEAAFENARTAYECSHWHQAYTAYAALADRGQAEAARIALQMWRQGPRLYGTTFAIDDAQAQRWARLVKCPGGGLDCPTAQASR